MDNMGRIHNRLSEKDRQEIKHNKRMAYTLSILILSFGFLFNICFIFIYAEYDNNLLTLIDIGIVLFCIILIFLMNRKYNLDLMENEVVVIKKQVQLKYTELSYEAGSGRLSIPKGSYVYYLAIDGYRKDVEKELYDVINDGDFVEMYYAKNSMLLLDIKKINSLK